MFTRILQGFQSIPDCEADYCHILGDLNYRFKTTYTKHIQQVNHSSEMIPELDELFQERQQGKYPHYYEMPIKFKPTYKRDFQSNIFWVFKKDQCPSYCDRILVKQNCKQSQIKYQSYQCLDEVFGSDHSYKFINGVIDKLAKKLRKATQRL